MCSPEAEVMKKIWARQALTEDGWQDSVLLTIDKSGTIATVEANAAADGEIRSILLPAPANLHSHAFQRVMAGLTETRSLEKGDNFWTWRKTMYALLEHLSPEDVQAVAAFAQMEMLEAGFAGVAEFHYLHHEVGGQAYANPGEMSARVAAAAKETGIGLMLLPALYERGGIDGSPLEGVQQRFGCNLDRFAKILDAARLAVAELPPDSRVGIALHSMRSVSLETITQAQTLFSNSVLHIHAAEQTAEVESVTAATSLRPVEWLLENCQINDGWCLVHCTHLTPVETRRLAESGAVAGLCPITESNLGDGIFNGRDFIRNGGTFGIGTDSNVRISLTEELRTLEYSQRLRHRIRAALASNHDSPGRELFETACRGGALACRRNGGRIGPGALADLIELDGDGIDLAGLEADRILDAWIFSANRNLVRNVWSAGRHAVRDGLHCRREAITRKYLPVQNRLRNLAQGT